SGMSAGWVVQWIYHSWRGRLTGSGMSCGGVACSSEAGSTSVAKVADSFFLYAHGTTSGPQLKKTGAYVTVGQLGAWVPIGAEHRSEERRVGKEYGRRGAEQYTERTTEINGNVTGQTSD